MTKNYINVSVSTSKPTRVNVSAPANQQNIDVTRDTSAYNAELSKLWAVSESLVLSEDYSSKYYANVSKNHAENAKNYLDTTIENYNNFMDQSSDALGQITDLKDVAKEEINSTKTSVIGDIEFVAETEKQEINNSKTEVINAINKTGINTKVSKSGDTMTGNLVIEKPADISAITFKRNDIATGDTPSETTRIMQLVSQDKNGESVAMVQSYIGTTGDSNLQLAVKQGANSYGTVTLAQNSEGNTTFTFPRCTTKATTTSSASSGKVAVVVQNYVNGYSWYRIWSDGWIEQGGQAHATTGLGTLNLTKTFSSIGYCVQVSQATTDGAYSNNHFIMIYEKKTTSFKVKTNATTASGGIPFSWYACGY